jgi:hypothetical protein
MPEATRMRGLEFMQLSLFLIPFYARRLIGYSPILSRCTQKAGIKEREFMGQQ